MSEDNNDSEDIKNNKDIGDNEDIKDKEDIENLESPWEPGSITILTGSMAALG